MPDAPITDPVIVTPVPIDIGNGRVKTILVPPDAIKYFNITIATVVPTQKLVTRKLHDRDRYNNNLSSTTPDAKPITVRKSTWNAPAAIPEGGRGKIFTVPTEMLTSRNNIRTLTLRAPSGCTNGAISNWIARMFTAHKPAFFWSNSGRKLLVQPITGDVNPGPDTATNA